MNSFETNLELLETILQEYCPALSQEQRFTGERAFRLDFADTKKKIAFEYEGFSTIAGQLGGHMTFSGYKKDVEKYNLLAANGWRLIRFTPQHFFRLKAGLKVHAGVIDLLNKVYRKKKTFSGWIHEPKKRVKKRKSRRKTHDAYRKTILDPSV